MLRCLKSFLKERNARDELIEKAIINKLEKQNENK
jgi:hypothetical protein